MPAVIILVIAGLLAAVWITREHAMEQSPKGQAGNELSSRVQAPPDSRQQSQNAASSPQQQASASPSPQLPVRGDCPAGMAAIPGGVFLMGSSTGSDSEKPAHRVEIDPFCMDITEVTVDAYRRCFDAHGAGCTAPSTSPIWIWVFKCNWARQGRENHPLNCVAWHQASSFCGWAGKRLPAEAEWEFAARGGSELREYPWGNSPPSSSNTCWNGSDGTCLGKSFPAGAFGLHDMSGGVNEWVQDWYAPYLLSPSKNYAGPPNGSRRVVRGGFWDTVLPSDLRGAHRGSVDPGPDAGLGFRNGSGLGFRCAKTIAGSST